MNILYYDDTLKQEPIPESIFLAGPTARDNARTAWRQYVIDRMSWRDWNGTLIIPEFLSPAEARFEERFGPPGNESATAMTGIRPISYNILEWETTGIHYATAVLFWMPFNATDLRGLTTRAEVARETQRDPSRIVLGMPDDAISGGHIKFHAYRAGLRVVPTLDSTIGYAIHLVESRTRAVVEG